MIAKENKRGVEIYGVQKNSDEHVLLKKRGRRRHSKKRCRYKWSRDISAEENNFLHSIYWEGEEYKELQERYKELQEKHKELLEKYKELQEKIKYKAPKNKNKKPDPTKHETTKPVMNRYLVKDGMISVSNLEYLYTEKTDLEDWLYKSIDPAIKCELPMHSYDLRDKEIERMDSSPFDKQPPKRVVKKKNFSSIFEGMHFDGSQIVQTDGRYLQITKSNIDADYEQFTIPFAFYDYCFGYDSYQLSKDKEWIRLTNGDQTLIIPLIPWNRPDYQNENIIPTTDATNTITITKEVMKQKKKIAKIKEERIEVAPNLYVNRDQSKYMIGTREYREGMTMLVSRDEWVRVVRCQTWK